MAASQVASAQNSTNLPIVASMAVGQNLSGAAGSNLTASERSCACGRTGAQNGVASGDFSAERASKDMGLHVSPRSRRRGQLGWAGFQTTCEPLPEGQAFETRAFLLAGVPRLVQHKTRFGRVWWQIIV